MTEHRANGTSAAMRVLPRRRWILDPLSARLRGPRGRRFRWALLVALFLMCLAGPAVQISDSRLTVPTALSVVRERNLDLSEYPEVRTLKNTYDVVDIDGRPYWNFPWPTALIAVPASAVALVLPNVDPVSWSIENPVGTWPVELPLAALMITITAFLMFRTIHLLIEDEATAVVVTGIAVLGTPLLSTGTRALWSQTAALPFIAGLVLLAVRANQSQRLAPFSMGVLAAAAYVFRPTAVVLVAPILLWAALRWSRLIPRLVGGIASVVVPFILINLATYESVLAPYYDAKKLAVTSEAFKAAAGSLVSPSRGLLWFSPIFILVVLGAVRSLRHGDRLALALVVGCMMHWLLIVTWPLWWGGATFGPRLFMEAIPLYVVLALPALPALPRARVPAAVVALVMTSLVVNFQGAYIRGAYCWSASPVSVDVVPQRLWDWSDPQFIRGYRLLLTGHSVRQVVAGSCSSDPEVA